MTLVGESEIGGQLGEVVFATGEPLKPGAGSKPHTVT
jgi:hypothetical protein